MQEQKAKFEIRELLPIAMTFVVLGIGLAYGLDVLGDVRDGFASGTAERNATVDTITGVSKIPNKLPMIATIVVAAVIIGILIRYLVVR